MLDHQESEWQEVEDIRYIKTSEKLENNSLNFTYKASFVECGVFVMPCNNWSVFCREDVFENVCFVAADFDRVVHLLKINDDAQTEVRTKCACNRCLTEQEENVEKLKEETEHKHGEAEAPANNLLVE